MDERFQTVLYRVVAIISGIVLLLASSSGSVSNNHKLSGNTTKVVGYGLIVITIPKSWQVQYQPSCPRSQTVTLGEPFLGPTSTCAFASFSQGMVWMMPMPLTSINEDAHASVLKLSGLKVFSLKTTDSPEGQLASTIDVPKYQVRVQAIGLDSVKIVRSVGLLNS